MSGLLVVVGAVTPAGRLDRAVHAAAAAASAEQAQVDVLSLATTPLPYAGLAPIDGSPGPAQAFTQRVADASGIVFASPVYRASLTGALKNALDLLPVEALQGKPVGIVAMGASDHHYLGVESHLRDILGWFGALVAPTSVYLTSADFADGVPSTGGGARLQELFRTVVSLADRLREPQRLSLGPAPLAARKSR